MVYKPTSLYIDPTKRTQEMEDFGIRSLPEFKGSAYNLGAVEGFPDVRYATTDYGKYSDLYRLYSGMPGGFDTAPETTPPTSGGGGTGGGGGAGTGTTTGGTGGVNTPFEQNLIDQGAGVQIAPGQPVVAPGEMLVTQEEMDAFNQIPVTPVNEFPTGDASLAEQIAAEDRIAKTRADEQAANIREQYGAEGQYKGPTPTYYDDTATLQDAGGVDISPREGVLYGTDYGLDISPSGPGIDKGEITPQAIDPTGMLPQISTYTPEQTIAGDVYAGGDYSDVARTLGDPNEKLDFKGAEDVAKKFNFDLGSAAVKFAINSAVGKPVTFFIDLLKDILPPADPRHTAMKEFYNLDETGKIAQGELMAGYGPVHGGLFGDTQYGLQEAYDKRIETVGETLQRNYGFSDEEIEQIKAGNITDAMRKKAYNKKMGTTTNNLQKLADLAEAKEKEKARLDLFSGDIDERDQMLEDIVAQNKAEAEGDAIRLRQLTGDLDLDKQATIPLGPEPDLEIEELKTREEQEMLDEITVEEIADIADRQPEVIETKKNELAEIYDRQVERGEREDTPTVTSKTNKAKEVINMPQMLGDVGGSMDDPPPQAPTRTVSRTDTNYGQFGRRQEATSAGGGNDGGGGNGGKIVCTMMNESYGFGSFRNKIWLKHSKDLAPEYQRGYHKIFLPLVKYAKQDGTTNRIVKKVLEHIAVHRTIDIRQEARGKRHLLGRIYRKILEPICYWAGK